ncbi:MAG: cyanophycinase [Planctomycetaceae bacterium]|nr:cyanophycinase [Planctomycetaceae bacterium]
MSTTLSQVGLTLLVILVGPILAQARELTPTTEPIAHQGIAGTLLLGSASISSATVERFVAAAGKEQARMVIVTSRITNPTVVVLREQLQAAKVASLNIVAPAAAVEHADVKAATGMWLIHVDKVSPELNVRLQTHLDAGHTLAISGSAAEQVGVGGWNLLPGGIVKLEPTGQDHSSAMFKQLTQSPGTFGMLIESSNNDGPTVIVQGREIRQLGTGRVRFVLAASKTRPVRTEALNPQGVEDLTLWRRAAIARTQTPFPVEKPAEPIVKHGSLVIVGGGGMPDDVLKKFIELAGGLDAPIVVLPTSMPDPLPADSGAAFFKRIGATRVTTITARKKADVETVANLAALREAKAIWFGGGRQWRFVDAYEGTAARPLIDDVLRRGGVIGGSSAGATIQGDYLVRGSPHGPQFMMCEGYERGFCFLPGVAIDQHFAQRKRFADMTQLMKAYPQYLGIGLDEATAIVVQQQVATVMGRGEVHLYDRRLPVPREGNDYQSFKAGTRLDLVTRKALPPTGTADTATK